MEAKIDKVQRHRNLCDQLSKIYEQKNHDYGDSFGKTFQEEGFAMSRIRLSDKLNRFKSLSKKPESQQVADESIRDTLLDLANYAIMTVLEMDILQEKSFVESIGMQAVPMGGGAGLSTRTPYPNMSAGYVSCESNLHNQI